MAYLQGIIEGKKDLPFEGKVMNTFLLMGIVMNIIDILIDLYTHSNVLMDVIFTICWIITYFLLEKYDWIIIVAFVVLIFGLLPYGWVMSSGIFSIMPYYAISFIPIVGIVTRGGWRKLLLGSIILVELVMTYYDSVNAHDVPRVAFIISLSHLVTVSVITVILIIYYSDTYAKEKKKNLAYAKVIEEQSREQLYYLEYLEEINSKLRAERHDFNNHIGIIYGLMEGHEEEKAKDYTLILVENAEHYRHMISLPYPAIQAIINYKLAIALKENIKIKVDADVPRGLKINEFDIGIVLGNLIDNAIRGVKKVEEEKRYLVLNIRYKPDYLIISIENPYVEAVVMKDDRYISMKEDSENHGYGLQNVKNIVEKYEGMLNISHENHYFKVDVAILV